MKQIIFKKEINSTNTFLKENYNSLTNETIIYTNHQTNGRGRTTHNWYDEDGKNLLMSILYKDKTLNEFLDKITLVVAVGVYNVLTKYLDNVTIKWPNDIYVSGKKICGILCEGITSNNDVALVIGIGLNVNGTIYPDDIKENTTSLKLITNKTYSRKRLLKKIYKELTKEINKLKQKDYSFLNIIQDNFYLKDKTINYIKQDITYTGKVLGINSEGKLIVLVDNQEVILNSGEVVIKK